MSAADRRLPWFTIRANRSRLLEEQGCSPWVFEAVTLLCFLRGKKRIQRSDPLPFRLDTGAFVSLIPEAWIGQKGLSRFLRNLSAEVSFSTAAGTGTGHLARGVTVQFAMDPLGAYTVDFLVSRNLNDREYGLLALRDVIRHFDIATQGRWRVDADGRPIEIPNLMLTPRPA